MNAAGILFRSPAGRVLLLRRVDGSWGFPGGACKEGETPAQAAIRETLEETKYRSGHAGHLHCRSVRDGVDFTTFLYACDDEFVPRLNGEHTAFMWIDPKEVLGEGAGARSDDAEWRESEHKRVPAGSPGGGQFGAGGGGKAAPSEKQPAGGGAEPAEREAARATEIAATAERIVGSIPGAREKIEAARAKLATAVPTDAPVAQGGHKMENGQYTPERQEVHKALLRKMFTPEAIATAKPAADEKPAIHFLGGSGGSGKSWFTGKNGTIDKTKAFYINSDDLKEALPEYQGWNAAQLHEESSDLGKKIEETARGLGLNVILDGTMSSLGSLDKRIGQYRDAGYQVHGHFMRVKPETSAKRAVERFVRGGERGRLVNPAMILASNNVQNFGTISPRMDSWEMFDNEGAAPTLVDRSEEKASQARL
jgi:ADP-ribose pyrophosphatase YjhB (NUDIX family)/predicted ABC-type ATPase